MFGLRMGVHIEMASPHGYPTPFLP
jgi:hypothetical protein